MRTLSKIKAARALLSSVLLAVITAVWALIPPSADAVTFIGGGGGGGSFTGELSSNALTDSTGPVTVHDSDGLLLRESDGSFADGTLPACALGKQGLIAMVDEGGVYGACECSYFNGAYHWVPMDNLTTCGGLSTDYPAILHGHTIRNVNTTVNSGAVGVDDDLIPATSATFDLGVFGSRWDNIHSQYMQFYASLYAWGTVLNPGAGNSGMVSVEDDQGFRVTNGSDTTTYFEADATSTRSSVVLNANAGLAVPAGLVDIYNSIRNPATSSPVKITDPEGLRLLNASGVAPTSLTTCDATSVGSVQSYSDGTSTGFCMCVYDGTTYGWLSADGETSCGGGAKPATGTYGELHANKVTLAGTLSGAVPANSDATNGSTAAYPAADNFTAISGSATNIGTGACRDVTCNSSGSFTITDPGVYMVNLSYSISSSTSNINVLCAVHVDGVAQDECYIERKIATGSDVGALSGTCIVDLAATDVVDFRCQHDDASSVTLTFPFGSFAIDREH